MENARLPLVGLDPNTDPRVVHGSQLLQSKASFTAVRPNNEQKLSMRRKVPGDIAPARFLILGALIAHKAAASKAELLVESQLVKLLGRRDIAKKLSSQDTGSSNWLQRSHTRRLNQLQAAVEQQSTQTSTHTKNIEQLFNSTSAAKSGLPAASADVHKLREEVRHCSDKLAIEQEERSRLAIDFQQLKALVSNLTAHMQPATACQAPEAANHQAASEDHIGHSKQVPGRGYSEAGAPAASHCQTEGTATDIEQAAASAPESVSALHLPSADLTREKQEELSARCEADTAPATGKASPRDARHAATTSSASGPKIPSEGEPAAEGVTPAGTPEFSEKSGSAEMPHGAVAASEAQQGQPVQAELGVSVAEAVEKRLDALECAHRVAVEQAGNAERRAAEVGMSVAAAKQRLDTLEWAMGTAYNQHADDLAAVRQEASEQICKLQASVSDVVKSLASRKSEEAAAKRALDRRLAENAAVLESFRQAVQEDQAEQWARISGAIAQLYKDVGSEIGEVQKSLLCGRSQTDITAQVIQMVTNQESALTKFTTRIEALEDWVASPSSQHGSGSLQSRLDAAERAPESQLAIVSSQDNTSSLHSRLGALEKGQAEQWHWMSQTAAQIYADLGGEISDEVVKGLMDAAVDSANDAAVESSDDAVLDRSPKLLPELSEACVPGADGQQREGEQPTKELQVPSSSAALFIRALRSQEAAVSGMSEQIRVLEERLGLGDDERHLSEASVQSRLSALEKEQAQQKEWLADKVVLIQGDGAGETRELYESPPQHATEIEEITRVSGSAAASAASAQSGSAIESCAVHAAAFEEIDGQISALAERLVRSDHLPMSGSPFRLHGGVLARQTPDVEVQSPASPTYAHGLDAQTAGESCQPAASSNGEPAGASQSSKQCAQIDASAAPCLPNVLDTAKMQLDKNATPSTPQSTAQHCEPRPLDCATCRPQKDIESAAGLSPKATPTPGTFARRLAGDDSPPATPQTAAALEALAAAPIVLTAQATASQSPAGSAANLRSESLAAEMQQLATIGGALSELHHQHDAIRVTSGLSVKKLEMAIHRISKHCADSLTHVTAGAIHQGRITAALAVRVAEIEAHNITPQPQVA